MRQVISRFSPFGMTNHYTFVLDKIDAIKALAARHAWPKWPECHNLASYQTKMAHFPPNFLRKSQKSPIFDQKCSCLVTLRSGSTEIQFQPELPELYIFHQKIGDFGIFSKCFVKYPQKHLVTGQIVTFWPFGKNMSVFNPFFSVWGFRVSVNRLHHYSRRNWYHVHEEWKFSLHFHGKFGQWQCLCCSYSIKCRRKL